MGRQDILKRICKKDGTAPTLRTIDALLAKCRDNTDWRGEDSSGGGRPTAMTAADHESLKKLVFAERGKAVVTVPYCKKRLPRLRKVSDETVRVALHRTGLAWMTRRVKSSVPKNHKEARLQYCRWLLKRRAPTLDRYAYTDGTTFYLARTEEENESKQRAGLGRYVWRMASGKDGLWDENIGPSCYAKGQGRPVKIWGLFANGYLEYFVLPADGARTTNMNGGRYNKLVKTKFRQWRRACFNDAKRAFLVKDHERCLWQDRNMQAEKEAGFDVLLNFPKCSPDLNAIEGWWKRLKERLFEQAPAGLESRAAFVLRLRRTVRWLNHNAQDEGRKLCTNQKLRAREVLALKGARCAW